MDAVVEVCLLSVHTAAAAAASVQIHPAAAQVLAVCAGASAAAACVCEAVGLVPSVLDSVHVRAVGTEAAADGVALAWLVEQFALDVFGAIQVQACPV